MGGKYGLYFVWSHPAPNHKIGFHILCFILLHCFQASWLWQLLHNLSGIFEIKKCFPRSVWEKFKSKARECLFIFESSSSLWQGQGDHEMIMLLLTFYGYCLKYGLICVGQRLFRNGLWPMLRAELEYDSDLDISLHLILNFFSRGRAINSESLEGYPAVSMYPCAMFHVHINLELGHKWISTRYMTRSRPPPCVTRVEWQNIFIVLLCLPATREI